MLQITFYRILALCLSGVWTEAKNVRFSESVQESIDEQTILKANLGLIFTPRLQEMHVTTSYEYTIFCVKIPQIKIPARLYNVLACPERSFGAPVDNLWGETQRYIEIMKHCAEVARRLNRGIGAFNAVIDKLSVVMADFNTTLLARTIPRARGVRNRRFLHFIGEIVGSAFGWVTARDFDKVRSYVEAIHDVSQINHENVVKVKDLLYTSINETSHRFGEMWKALENTRAILSDEVGTLANRTSRIFADIGQDMEFYSQLHFGQLASYMNIDAVIRDADQLYHTIITWVEAIEHLGTGRISTTLIPPSKLVQAIEALRKQLVQTNTGMDVVYSERMIAFYYNQDDARFWVQGNNLFISLPIAIGNPRFAVNVFEITSFPVPLHEVPGMQNNDTGYLAMNIEKPFLVVSKSKHLYKELTDVEFLTCIADGIKKCPALLALNNIVKTTCLIDVYLGNLDEAMSKCDYRIYPGNVPSTAVYLTNATYAITTSAPTVRITCEGIDKRQVQYTAPSMPL